MKTFTATYQITGNLGIENTVIDARTSNRIRHDFINALKDGNARLVYTDGMADAMQHDKLLDHPNATYLTIVLPAPPDSIKGSEGNIDKAVLQVLESYNTELTSISIDDTTVRARFEYIGTIHYAVEEKKLKTNYDVFTFVADGNFGIHNLHHAYKAELVRRCLDALNNSKTVLYETAAHTTDFDENLPEVLEVPEFSNLVIQLSVPKGEVTVEGADEDDIDNHAMPYDINVFNADGTFTPEKIVYDDGDGIKKVIVSLYYTSN